MEPIQIFVSYSHVDRRWFVDKDQPHSLIPWLQYVLRRHDVVFWHDRSDEAGLQPGDRFRDEIERSIDRSEIALLLLSDAFFASDFIQTVELPRILAREKSNRMVVIPILLEPCGWQDFEFVAQHHMLPGTPTPLIYYTRNDADWSEARNVIREAIGRRAKEVRGKGPIGTEPSARQTVSLSPAIAATGPSEDRPTAAKAPEVPSPADMPAPAIKTAEDKYTLGVGTADYCGEILLRDGSKEVYIWINTGKWGGQTLDFARDENGGKRRELSLANISRIDIVGSTQGAWARANIALTSGQVLEGVYLNIAGYVGAWNWCYRTALYLGNIDDNVAAITFRRR